MGGGRRDGEVREGKEKDLKRKTQIKGVIGLFKWEGD